jgi:hypothetical protein
MVQKVPQLHLARLFCLNDIVYGAKVVTRSLGAPVDVCSRLLDAARHDGAQQAKCTLHGLSDFSSKQPQLSSFSFENTNTSINQDKLEALARDFIQSQNCTEANLYISHGAQLTQILHHADKSEFADTCGGAMALFQWL